MKRRQYKSKGSLNCFSEYNRVGNLNNLIILGILDSNEGQLNLSMYTVELEPDTLTTQGLIVIHKTVYKPIKNILCYFQSNLKHK